MKANLEVCGGAGAEVEAEEGTHACLVLGALDAVARQEVCACRTTDTLYQYLVSKLLGAAQPKEDSR
jgi:hypothetical protein